MKAAVKTRLAKQYEKHCVRVREQIKKFEQNKSSVFDIKVSEPMNEAQLDNLETAVEKSGVREYPREMFSIERRYWGNGEAVAKFYEMYYLG
jgi:hypothetical protein